MLLQPRLPRTGCPNTVCVWCLLTIAALPVFASDDSWVYAVQLHAVTQSNPPAITLGWKADPYGATNFTIYRKQKEDNSWGDPIKMLPGSATNFTDFDIVVAKAYEYRVDKDAWLGYRGYGYIYSGIGVPMIENRGTMIVLAEQEAAANLKPELARLRQDLVGDGWHIMSFTVSAADSPESVQQLIRDACLADTNVNTAFLFGHVPVPLSGDLNWDTHGARAMPADAYYGDVNDDWSLDPASSASYLPSDAKLVVGRVDFFDMKGEGAPSPWPSEIELLRHYLDKDHRWRHKMFTVPRRALMGNARGDELGEATASTGYRNFEPLVGPDQTKEADVSWDPPLESRWISYLADGAYLWAYGCGGGAPEGCGALGTNIVGGVPGFLFSRDVLAMDAKAVFVLMFGSWFGEWNLPDNLLRSFLMTSTGLASGLAGRPHWFLHHMSMGETIGYGLRLSLNNRDLYLTQSNRFPRAVYTALMGDPSLRMEQLAPATNFAAIALPGAVQMSWTGSPDPVLGYHVYRASGSEGPFTRITPSLVTHTSFQDNGVSPGTYVYMLRAVALQENPSGSYLNASQGVFATALISAPAIYVQAEPVAEGVRLKWNSQAGTVYRVLARESGEVGRWSDVSGPLTAVTTNALWVDLAPSSNCRYYRVQWSP